MSDGDCDSSAGDLEEWDFVDFKNIPKVNDLFEKMYPNINEQIFTNEQKDFYDKKKHEDIKILFKYLCMYCVKDKGNMSSFEQLLDDENIENKYSVYRSSGD